MGPAPNVVSLVGLGLAALSGLLVLEGSFVWAAVAFFVGSAMDGVDGNYARLSGGG